MNEAGHLAMEGIPITEIDAALLKFGMPMGPFRLMDEIGLDVAGHVGPILYQGLGERYKQSEDFPRLLERNKQYLGKHHTSHAHTMTS
jgi:3-hydroxyacyl-CoA dehydrogenase/enoyl-CoA hydratase/3-hydroxybutyryl-CoA epimerase